MSREEEAHSDNHLSRYLVMKGLNQCMRRRIMSALFLCFMRYRKWIKVIASSISCCYEWMTVFMSLGWFLLDSASHLFPEIQWNPVIYLILSLVLHVISNSLIFRQSLSFLSNRFNLLSASSHLLSCVSSSFCHVSCFRLLCYVILIYSFPCLLLCRLVVSPFFPLLLLCVISVTRSLSLSFLGPLHQCVSFIECRSSSMWR